MHDNRGTHPLFSSERASFVFAVCLLVIVGCQGLSSTITKHMFDPTQQQAKKTEKKIKKAAIKKLKQWSLEIIPMECSEKLLIDISEVVCGDPNCAPIDTVVSLVWETGGRGIWGIPAEVQDIGKDDYLQYFPDEETIRAWARGEESEWPKRPELRFTVGTRVECRVSPHPVRGWAPGKVVALWYREDNWPPGQMAPYQVQLDDARLIFAPQDFDQVIRAEQSVSETIAEEVSA